MSTFAELKTARKTLQLPETASMAEIKSRYRELLAAWHPDRCRHPEEECAEMTRRIVAAYQRLMDYCRNYRYSFSEETVKRHLSPEEWWLERFGEEPLWANARRMK